MSFVKYIYIITQRPFLNQCIIFTYNLQSIIHKSFKIFINTHDSCLVNTNIKIRRNFQLSNASSF